MKFMAFVCLLQVVVCFAYGQSTDSLQKMEFQKQIEQQLFPGTKAETATGFSFSNSFEEVIVETFDGYKLFGLLFKVPKSKGVLFYLHGSNGGLDTWSKIAPTYTNLGYDIFMLDYRGYGKSESKVTSEKQLYSDVQAAYNKIKLRYSESKIVVLGQSLGTAPAAMLSAYNNPRKLILQAPYYSIPDWISNIAPGVDTSDLQYQLRTYEFLKKSKAPVIIFHGDADKAIYFGSSKKLSLLFKPGDELVTLVGEGHNDFTKNKMYLEKLKTVLK